MGQTAKLRCDLSDSADEFAASSSSFSTDGASRRRRPGVPREHVEAYLVEVGEERGWKPSTARTAPRRYLRERDRHPRRTAPAVGRAEGAP